MSSPKMSPMMMKRLIMRRLDNAAGAKCKPPSVKLMPATVGSIHFNPYGLRTDYHRLGQRSEMLFERSPPHPRLGYTCVYAIVFSKEYPSALLGEDEALARDIPGSYHQVQLP